MNFQDDLELLVKETEGARSALLMGFDGIPVAEYRLPEETAPIQDFMVECAQLTSSALKMFQGNQLGNLIEMVLSSGETKLILRVISPEYFVGLFINVDGNIGKGRYLLRRKASDLQAQL
jgi:predicted regulator of Ras-like GTPase activity (Roadblock/LC7/MglB family)